MIHAIETVDYTADPPLNIPEKYQHMVWFALPIDIALMMLKMHETNEDIDCDINTIPFMPDDAKARILNSAKSKLSANRRDLSQNRKKISSSRGSSKTRVR